MKVIIAGTRSISVMPSDIESYLSEHLNSITEIVSGGAKGVDSSGEEFAKSKGIKIVRFLPDWNSYGKSAGPIRNRSMAKYGDLLLLIWDGSSKGSANMKAEMKKLGKPVIEIIGGVIHDNNQ